MIKRSTILALLAAVALLGAGCGKDSEKGGRIPASLASTLEQRLQVIQSQVDRGGGACTDITDKTEPVVRRDLDRIPDSVDPDVRDALVNSFDRLFELTSSQCQGTTTETTPTETNTTPTETQQTETQQTDTQQTDTQQTETQQTPTQELPPGQQKKKNGNNGNGNGNGGGPAAPGQ